MTSDGVSNTFPGDSGERYNPAVPGTGQYDSNIPGDAYRTLTFSDEVEYAAGTGDFDALRAISPATKIMLVDLDSPSQLPVFYGRRMSAEESISLGSTMQSGSMGFVELI